MEGFDELFQKVSNWEVWGDEDARGTLNYITPECVRAAAQLIVASPLRLPGGTGSFFNPIAIFQLRKGT